MNADLVMGEELKKTGAGNLFTVFGEPDIEIKTDGDELRVVLHGVDVYDPNTGEIRSDDTDQIALWMIDTDYNGESFFVRHCYFTGGQDPYARLKRALKADIDEDAWASLYRTESRPFPRPETGKIAVKVINDYGDEVAQGLRGVAVGGDAPTPAPAGQYLARRRNHLGSIKKDLGDLQGWRSLIAELIQNADDASDATEMSFTIDDDALTVWNDGTFSKCDRTGRSDLPLAAAGRSSLRLPQLQRRRRRSEGGSGRRDWCIRNRLHRGLPGHRSTGAHVVGKAVDDRRDQTRGVADLQRGRRRRGRNGVPPAMGPRAELHATGARTAGHDV